MTHDSLDELPDLEIYVKGEPTDAILAWIKAHFQQTVIARSSPKTVTLTAQWNALPIEIFVCKNAGRTGFTSISFNRKDIPWSNDIECARAAHAALGVEIRCSESAWREGDDPDRWYAINAQGEGVIHWQTD